MNKNIIVSTLAGLAIGAIIGFWGANYMNKNAAPPNSAASVASESVSSPQAVIPAAGQPQTQTASSPDSATALADVQEKLDNAKKRPDDATAQLEAGDMYLEIERFDEALEFYSKAAKLRPASFDAQANIGRIHYIKKDYKKAGEYYEKALALDGRNVGLRSDLGLTYFLREPPDIERAVKEFNAALEINPDHEATLQNMSVALKELGRDEERSKTLEKLKKINPKNQLFTDPKEPG